MNINDILTVELAKTAAGLQERFRTLHVSTRTIPLEEWSAVPQKFQKLVPNWIQVLLANFSLCGGFLEYRANYSGFNCMFGFADPYAYAAHLGSNNPHLDKLIERGFFVLGEEEDGNFWVIQPDSGPQSPIYLWDLSARELVFASSRLSLFLACMGIASQIVSGTTKAAPVLWHPEV